MKLAYIIEHVAGTGGLERNISTKSNYFAEQYNYEVTIITIYQKERPFAYKLHPSIKTIDLGVSFEGKKSKIIKKEIYQALESVLMREKFDICVSWCGMDVYSLYKIKDGSRKIAEFHFDYSTFDMWESSNIRVISKIKAYIKRRSFIKAIKEYEYFVALTEQDAHHWKKYCDNVVRIYNPLFLNIDGKRKISTKTVCAIGRLDHQKGYDLLIPAWRRVADLYPDWILKIHGEGSERDMLQELIDTNNLQNNVRLCGYTPNVGGELSQSDIFVFPSRYEGFGNVLIEAMSYGVPPVSFDCPCGPSEIIEDGVSGILVRHMDIDALISNVIQLMEDSDRRNVMSKAAIKRSKVFSQKIIFAQWDNLFDGL